MHTWFQNLNESKRRLFHFRGSIGSSWENTWLRYEICSGPELRFELENDDDERKARISLGLLFLTIFLTFPRRKIPLLKPDRRYGFYIYEWKMWAFFGARKWESRHDDPWYYNIVLDPLTWLFGKEIFFEDEKLKTYSPVLFEFRGKQYEMDSIVINKAFWFRERIPFAWYKKQMLRMHLKIEKPPGYAGKGENSWDCGDDASYGMTAPYKGPAPSWKNAEEVFAFCCAEYCASVSKDIKRYGRASGDTVPHDEVGFKYIGHSAGERISDGICLQS